MSSSTLIQDSPNVGESQPNAASYPSSFTDGCPVSKPTMQCSLSSLSSLSDYTSPGLSSSSSSLSSNNSTVSLNSTSTSISNDLTVHFMLYNSINVISKRYAGTDIYFKAASFDMNDIMEGSRATVDEDMEIGDEYPVDIAVMNNLEYKFHPQEPFGRLLQNNEFVMLRSRMPMTEHIGIRVDLFKKINNENERFEKIAFGYVYPLDINESSGFCIMPITSDTGKIVAKMKAEYFFTRPYRGFLVEDFVIKSKTRKPKSWQLKKDGFDIGHRGAGSARRVDHNEKILENTVDSFNYAFKQGADMVELDVQLSKDKVPIVYHDFNVNIILQKKDRDIESFEVNIKDLTFSQLQKLKLNPVLHGKETYNFDEEVYKPHNQPFASFRSVLESVDANCGFNVEIKYPQKKINGQWEAQKSHDLNEYVDLILQDLFSYAGERNIIISSFHPEICSLVKLKQDCYPVLFLTQGLTKKWMQYANPLNHSIKMAVYLALCMGLYGVAVHAEDIINDRTLIHFVKSKFLILFCWGDDLNDRELIKNLKKAGVDGAIYDKIDLLVAKEDQIQNEHQAIQLQ